MTLIPSYTLRYHFTSVVHFIQLCLMCQRFSYCKLLMRKELSWELLNKVTLFRKIVYLETTYLIFYWKCVKVYLYFEKNEVLKNCVYKVKSKKLAYNLVNQSLTVSLVEWVCTLSHKPWPSSILQNTRTTNCLISTYRWLRWCAIIL